MTLSYITRRSSCKATSWHVELQTSRLILSALSLQFPTFVYSTSLCITGTLSIVLLDVAAKNEWRRNVRLNIFYSGIKHTEKYWVRLKVRHNPLQKGKEEVQKQDITNMNTEERWDLEAL